MDGNRAVFIAQNGINLLRVLAGNQAQRIAVIAADAVGNIATFAIADADNFTAGKVTGDGFDAFWQQGAAAFQNRLGGAGIHANFTRRRGTEDPAFAVLQRRFLRVEAGTDRHALHHIGNHTGTVAGGNNSVDTGTTGDIGGLQLGSHTAGAQAGNAIAGDGAQGIINASKNIIHTSKTATNMVSNFQETVKIYQQGKKYYDALKSVNNLVKDARKVQQTILMVGDITDIYVNSFQRMLRDGNFRPEELSAIAFGYTKLLEESNEVLTELRNVVNITTLSMTDKERMDVVERCHSKMKRYRNLVSYYTNKNISVSYLRAKKKNDLDRIMGLYGNMNERYW